MPIDIPMAVTHAFIGKSFCVNTIISIFATTSIPNNIISEDEDIKLGAAEELINCIKAPLKFE